MSLTCLCQTDSFIFVVFQKLDHSDVSKNRFAQIRIWWRQYWEEDNIVWRQTHLCMKELVAIFCRNVWLISECGRAHTACVCVRAHAVALVFFSAIAGNIPQMTVTHSEMVGEGNSGVTESFFPERRVHKLHESFSKPCKSVIFSAGNKPQAASQEQCCCAAKCFPTFNCYRRHVRYVSRKNGET